MRLLPVTNRALIESRTNTSPDVKRPDEQGEIPRWSGHCDGHCGGHIGYLRPLLESAAGEKSFSRSVTSKFSTCPLAFMPMVR